MRRTKLLGWLGLALLMAPSCLELDAEDLACEQVVAKLDGCCGRDFQPSLISCGNIGCAGTTFDFDEIECLDELSCAEVIERDLCERVMAAAIERPEPISSEQQLPEEDFLCR